MLPQVFKAADSPIPLHCIKQEPGQYFITFPGAFHFVVNAGKNCADAIHFYLEWYPLALEEK
jgi:hypothetical protein